MIYRTLYGTPNRRFGSPLSELETMRRQMDRIFETYRNRPAGRVSAGVFPSINLTEDKEAYYVSAELPGVNTADLDLSVTANQLTLAV